jgi:hypothetical protein
MRKELYRGLANGCKFLHCDRGCNFICNSVATQEAQTGMIKVARSGCDDNIVIGFALPSCTSGWNWKKPFD